MHEHFVWLDHADFRAGTLFDHFQTILEVVEFSTQAIIRQLRGSIPDVMRLRQTLNDQKQQNAAATKPQLALQHEQQGNQHEVEWSKHHA